MLDLFVVVTDTWGLHPVNSSYLKSNPFFSPRGKFLEAEIARVLAIEDWILLLSGGLEDMEVLRVLRGRIFLRLSELFHWGWLVGWLVGWSTRKTYPIQVEGCYAWKGLCTSCYA